jgi:parallel beta-helix repeat protein
MAVKCLGARSGEGTTADAVPALHYAVANGADVINASWGGDSESELLEDAIDYAHSQGVIVVAAAGNNDSDSAFYPASYHHVISVAATDPNDDKYYRSNYGDLVDIAAPGTNILSLKPVAASETVRSGQHTTVLSGTSMAAPHVAGACALLLSANPLLTGSEVYDKLVKTGDEIAPRICASNRRLNLFKAMRAVVPSRGYVRLDQDYYTRAGTIGVNVADWDLMGQGSQEVIFDTRLGDREEITLAETTSALGVFAGLISTESGEPNTYDGIIQVSDGEVIRVTYWDANDGAGRQTTATDEAIADYQAPTILDITIGARGPVARIAFLTDEPTTARIRCGLACGGPYTFAETDLVMSLYHTIRLQPLALNTDYYFVIDLTDAAGNVTTADNNDLCYSLSTQEEFLGFLVPGMYRTIQAAIDDAWDGDVIWVADGKYSGEGNIDVDFKGKVITVRSENGPESCIIDCQLDGRGFDFHSGEGQESVLDGFTITNGFGGKFGGGISCTASSPTITNCIVTGNSAKEYGGGMYNSYNSNPIVTYCTFSRNSMQSGAGCTGGSGGGMCNIDGSSPVITDCAFSDNVALYSGAGMYNYENSNPILTNCTFTGNHIENGEGRGGFGGGMSNWTSSPTLTRCTFSGSSAKTGGAMYNCYGSSPILTNCVFSANSGGFGGAIDNYEANVTLINCTLAGNSAEAAGGIWNGPGSSATVSNCILWGNVDSNGTDESAQISGADASEPSVVKYCCIQGATDALGRTGNIDVDPLFVDPNGGDYHLKSEGWRWDIGRQRWHYDDVTSLCIDVGNPGSPLRDEPLFVPDDPNNEWAVNLRINMGAYGGTAEASMAPCDWAIRADFNNDGIVNWRDFAYTASDLFAAIAEHGGDFDRDGVLTLGDVALLAEDWVKYVRPPVVSIVEPLDGARFEIPADVPIEIEAVAWDVDGVVIKVEFFSGRTKIGQDEDGSDGWKISWQNHVAGVHGVTARATDKGGVTAISPTVEITIIPPR